MPKEMWLHIRVRDYRRCWPLDWKELFRSRQHDVQRESLACHGEGIRAEDRRFSTRAGESRRLQLQGRARHRRATVPIILYYKDIKNAKCSGRPGARVSSQEQFRDRLLAAVATASGS